MFSSSSTFGRELCTLCGSTLGLFIRRFDSRISTSTTRFRPGGQRESILSMPSSRTTMPFSPQLQDVQIRMRRWVRWCDVHGLRFQFLCCWKGLQGVSRLWFGISKSLASRHRHRDSGCCPGSLAMEAETHRTRGGGGTLQVVFHRIEGTNPSSGANSLTTLSLGDVNPFVLCASLFRLCISIRTISFNLEIFFVDFIFLSKLQGQLWGVLAALRKTTDTSSSWEIQYIETLQFSLSSLKGALNLQCKFDAWPWNA